MKPYGWTILLKLPIIYHQFESIHPFQDGNGRVGRLILFKECLANGIVPFIITEELKLFYYRELQIWPVVKGFLMDTCLTAKTITKQSSIISESSINQVEEKNQTLP